MSTNLKTKKENLTGEEVSVEKSKPYLFETAPIHRDTGDFERPWMDISTLALEAASFEKKL